MNNSIFKKNAINHKKRRDFERRHRLKVIKLTKRGYLTMNSGKKNSIFQGDFLSLDQIKKEMPSSYKLIKRRCKFSNPINHPTVMLKKKDLIKYNYKNFSRMEDYYLWIKMSNRS